MSWPRPLLVARVLLRRRVRRALARPKRSALVGLLFLVPFLSLFAPERFGGGGFAVGENGTVSGDGATVRIAAILPPVFTAIWLLFFLAGAFTVDSRLDEVDGGDLLVLGGGVRATVLGVSLAEHARRLTLFGIWFVVGGLLIVVAGGGITSLPLGAVGFVLLLASASTAGHAVGLSARRALLNRGLPVRLTGVAIAVGGYLAFTAYTILPIGVDLPLRSVAASLPTAWFADWLLLEYPGATVDPARLLGSVVFGGTVAVSGFLAKERLAADVWFRDPGPEVDAGGSGSLGVVDGVRRLVRPLLGPAAAALSWQVVLRRLRSPAALVFPLAGLVVFQHDVRAALPAEFYPLAAAAYFGLTIPPAVALNPLADEGVGLPLVLGSGLGGRAFVAGYSAAAVLLSSVATVATTVVAGLLFGFSPIYAAAALVLVVLIGSVAAPTAVGAGTALPRNDAHETVDSEGVGLPSKFAFGVYLLVVAAAAVPFAAAVVLRGGAVTLALGAVGSLLLGSVAAAVAARDAANRFDGFVLG
jgi:ABC-2 type transport system permease protein